MAYALRLVLMLAFALVLAACSDEAGTDCSSVTTCGECTLLAGCGFCGATNQCLSGSSSGPTTETCGSDWTWLPNECRLLDAGPSPDAGP